MSAQFDLLPKELIAHIATFTAPSGVLKLSATCHTLRAACWDPLVWKAVLNTAQSSYWNNRSLDVEAIASRAENDTTIWAKYCIADERAQHLMEGSHDFHTAKTFIGFLPELLVVKHPFVAEDCWRDALRYRLDQNPKQIFCIAMTILSSSDLLPSLTKSLKMEGNWNLRDNSNPTGFLWGLCMIALTVRAGVRTRMAAWPFNHAARVPHIAIPTAEQIPLRPASHQYRLPVPFSRRAVELLGNPTTSFSGWDSWYQLHNVELFKSTEHLTRGSWNGYYIHFGNDPLAPLNPPMVDIHFEVTERSHEDSLEMTEFRSLKIRAKNCVDGVDFFDLEGAVSCSNYGVKLLVRKLYLNRGHGWDWDCTLTPFGIVGYWGLRNSTMNTLRREGIVWLWAKAWTEA